MDETRRKGALVVHLNPISAISAPALNVSYLQVKLQYTLPVDIYSTPRLRRG